MPFGWSLPELGRTARSGDGRDQRLSFGPGHGMHPRRFVHGDDGWISESIVPGMQLWLVHLYVRRWTAVRSRLRLRTPTRWHRAAHVRLRLGPPVKGVVALVGILGAVGCSAAHTVYPDGYEPDPNCMPLPPYTHSCSSASAAQSCSEWARRARVPPIPAGAFQWATPMGCDGAGNWCLEQTGTFPDGGLACGDQPACAPGYACAWAQWATGDPPRPGYVGCFCVPP